MANSAPINRITHTARLDEMRIKRCLAWNTKFRQAAVPAKSICMARKPNASPPQQAESPPFFYFFL
jgi:hypothetical protein